MCVLCEPVSAESILAACKEVGLFSDIVVKDADSDLKLPQRLPQTMKAAHAIIMTHAWSGEDMPMERRISAMQLQLSTFAQESLFNDCVERSTVWKSYPLLNPHKLKEAVALIQNIVTTQLRPLLVIQHLKNALGATQRVGHSILHPTIFISDDELDEWAEHEFENDPEMARGLVGCQPDT